MSASCCSTGHDHQNPRKDYFFWACLFIIVFGVLGSTLLPIPLLHEFGHHILDLLSVMWWGAAAGVLMVGLMGWVPKQYFPVLLGRGDTFGGIFRAVLAGVLLGLCSHGILMVGAKLYERGASLAQVMTFLIASPWNSFSLTLILIAMIGFKLTIAFILLSAVIAIITGSIYLQLIRRNILPANPNTIQQEENFDIIADAKARIKNFRPSMFFLRQTIATGWVEGKMVIRWLLFGIILAASIRTFIDPSTFATWFAPTLAGLGLTLIVTTIIEVCSEGSTPIGADLVTRAGAPGNGFAFLMAGVSTDYTEIMVLQNMTKSWKIALSLPLITVPQIFLLGWILNQFGS